MTCKANIGETTRFLKCTKLKRSRCVGQLVIRADQHSECGWQVPARRFDSGESGCRYQYAAEHSTV
jgi:hypothetical protein